MFCGHFRTPAALPN